MDSALQVASERIARFERLGGVDLSRLDEEEKHPLLAEVRIGIAQYKKAIFHFKCPLCGTRALNEQDMEPLCTGPHPSLNEHEPTVMVLEGRK